MELTRKFPPNPTLKHSLPQVLLQDGLQIVYKAASPRTAIPALSGILLQGRGDVLRLAATDLELAIECEVPVPVPESLAVVLPQRYLVDLVRRLPAGEITLEIEPVTYLSSFSWNGGEVSIHGLDARDFPQFPTLKNDSSFQISAGKLRKVIRETTYAAASSDLRPTMTGCLFECRQGVLEAAATDGFRIAYSRTELREENGLDLSAVIPVRALTELLRLLPDDDVEVQVEINKSQAVFRFARVSLITRLLEGQFPLYRQAVPSSFLTRAVFNPQKFIDTSERAALLASGESSPVKLRLSDQRILLLANTPEVGRVEEEIPARVEGENLEVTFNVHFLLEGLKALAGEENILEVSGALAPARLRRAGDDAAFSLILPIKTN